MRRSAGWVAFLAILAGLMITAGIVLAVGREDPLVAPSDDTGVFDTDGLLGWACPEGTVTTVSCGFVEVPADHDDPEINSQRLFVALFEGPEGETPTPLVVLGDRIGPGAVDDLGEWRQLSRDLERGIVLVDLRSTGSSEPQLSCIELLKANWLEVDLGDEQAIRLAREQRRRGVQRCLERMEELQGAAPLDVDTMARDLARVRQALEIEEWVLVGTDATAEVAVAAEAIDAAGVAATVLLAAAPATDDPLAQRFAYGQEALLSALDCGRPDCVGDPEFGLLIEAEEALGQRSVVFTTQVGSGRRRVSVNQGSLFPTLALGVHQAELRESLPDFVEGLADRQWRQLATVRGQEFPLLEYGQVSPSLWLNCGYPVAELSGPIAEPPPVVETPAGDGAEGEEAAPPEPPSGTDLLTDTRNWYSLADDPQLDPGLCQPARSIGVPLDRPPSGPVLVVNQAYDYRAPTSAADALRNAWPAAEVVVLDRGDRPDLRNPCVAELVSGFLGGGPTLEGSCQ
ncbi:MAG: hypothetical protein AAGA93_25690 [Actinomycetota bacterium]